ncbi:MAG: YegS/Rv2252/BmrU family lipid kinase [Oscillospiraceae bacterium]|nr:YegS/Rv2252/BmrU family lipid kinase [Oscillospiraceae bacterium]
MKNLLFLYNPTSGKGQIRQRLAGIIDTFTRGGWLVTAYPTQCRGDAGRMVREIGGRFERIVCAGGDGTLSETVSGMMELEEKCPLAFLPFGSTNDCAQNLRLPTGPVKAAQVAADGVPCPMDVGRLNDRHFIYVAAFGAFTDVAYDTPQELKNTFGHLAYLFAGLGQLANLVPHHLRVEYDGGVIEDDFLYGMVCNTYSVAGVKALPKEQVVLDDGLFEVLLVRKNVKLADLAAALQAIAGNKPMNTPAVVTFQTGRVTITADEPLAWTTDGEYGGTYAVSRLENCHNALTVIKGE